MRKAFVSTLVELAETDPRIMLLTADLGFMALEPFAERFPERFVNVGVAEQNMVGVATGLAESGFVPFVYSIVPFAVLRPLEFIRNGPIQHRLPVRIVGMGGGVSYASNGLSHYALEDIAVMRSQPGIQVVAPADHRQVRACIRDTWENPVPVYYRLEKDDLTTVPGLDGRFEIRRLQIVAEGTECLLVSMGGIAVETSAACALLDARGLKCTHCVMADIHPPPRKHLLELLNRHNLVFTVEAHYVSGGIGSVVAEVIAERAINCRLVRLGFNSMPDGRIGTTSYLLSKHGLDRDSIAAAIEREIAVGQAS